MMADNLAANAEVFISTFVLRDILDLPPEITVLGAVVEPHDFRDGVVRLVLNVPYLPSGGMRHLVTPVLRSVEAGKATLERLDILPANERQRP
jgi:hypothetical protein